MSDALYNTEILRLAASTAAAARLAAPHGSALKVSPVCGSKITADVELDDAGRICRFGQEVRACALGQASAALVAAHAIGSDAAALATARTELADWLATRSDIVPTWPGLAIFAPARPHRARHPSILLAFDATIAAIDAARSAARSATRSADAA
jgi:NifU-like protein involved in Fe-S cluster formation